MQIRSTLALAMIAGLGGTVQGAPVLSQSDNLIDNCAESMCAHTMYGIDVSGMNEAQVRGVRLIATQTFWSLPEEHRAKVAAGLMEQGEPVPGGIADNAAGDLDNLRARMAPLGEAEMAEAWELVKNVVDRDDFESFSPVSQRMLASFVPLAEQRREAGGAPVMPCFTPGTPIALVTAFETAVFGDVVDTGERFNQTTRWVNTANTSGAQQGDPVTLTYSFPSDGVSVPNGIGEGVGPNALNSFMDGIYGNRNTWRTIYDDMFAEWGDLSGNTYVLENNDDDSTLFNFDGVNGVRGDLRMAGKTIDGNSNVLAYNFFPPNGDMVIDTADNFYNTTTNDSQRLRNILSHEHGHGFGALHVCPVQQTKLMEPFISVAFTGPQFDDILNIQRHYGDRFEDPGNDSAGNATSLGSFSIGNSQTLTQLSIDDNADSDFFAVTANEDLFLSVTVRPQGFEYLEGSQNGDGSCQAGSPYNPLLFQDLNIAILDTNGTFVLDSADATGAGGNESVEDTINAGGTYFIRVQGSGANNIQAYELDIEAQTIPFQTLDLNLATPVPSQIDPGVPFNFILDIDQNDDTLIGTPSLNYRTAGTGSFTAVQMTPVIPGVSFTVDLPGQLCGPNVEYFFSAQAQTGGFIILPSIGEFSTAIGTEILNDNAETDIGWAVTGSATEGLWERGFPEGNGRDDPDVDFDGSGQCWLTDLDPNDTNSDIDGGDSVATSPAFDMSNGGVISYAYWMEDSTNTIGAEDYFRVEISTNDGASWSIARNYSPGGGWRTDSIDVGAEFGPSSTVRIRFAAADNDPGDVLECAFDAVVISNCVDPVDEDCPADVNGDGNADPADFTAWLGCFNDPGSAAFCDRADVNGSGAIDPSDFTAWLAAFQAGCP